MCRSVEPRGRELASRSDDVRAGHFLQLRHHGVQLTAAAAVKTTRGARAGGDADGGSLLEAAAKFQSTCHNRKPERQRETSETCVGEGSAVVSLWLQSPHVPLPSVARGDGEPVLQGEAASLDQQQPTVAHSGGAGPREAAVQPPICLHIRRRRLF
ncbi:hypothetical protein F2P81_012253 [Scophthalmus maximus]|uniref:Uncharacterized protein n=1 Tax=Scophthalmus maximus TaxID=52904 RepID=A0A6A4SPH7_SCOMX|nr:hypothetical protein F2P81_012253 [Scophthalmus maximus]